MNFLNIFEDHVAGIFGASRAPFSFKKLAKQAVREMEDQTLVINGVNTAPALYTILIANDDDPLMAPYYPQLTREVAEFVKAHAEKRKYVFVGEPLVRFMIDPQLRGGKFSVFAENVDAPTLGRLYEEERAYQQRKARQDEQDHQKQERLAQNQVLTLPDGSVTSRITWDTIHQLLEQPAQRGEAVPFQLVPGIPFQGQGHTFSRLACLAGVGQTQTRILIEEYSGTPGVPGRYAWTRDVDAGEAETVLRGWLQGKIPTLDGWTLMERSVRTWQQTMEHPIKEPALPPPQPHRKWPWQMTAGGHSGSTADFSWNDVEKALRQLNQEADSYLILEQRDPENSQQYWFIQCAVALKGPDAGRYAAEIGCSTPDGPRLWERMMPDVQDVLAYFSDAYHHRGLDVSGFREI